MQIQCEYSANTMQINVGWVHHLDRAMTRVGLAVGVLVMSLWPGSVQADETDRVPARPIGQHCKNVGPLADDPDFCGCTWGAVYAFGKPVQGAKITISVGGAISLTQSSPNGGETYPTYDFHGDVLGAKYGDVATIAASFQGQTLTRTVRLIPDQSKEQELSFAFPKLRWDNWQASSTVQALALQGNTLWVGSNSGLLSWNVSSGISTTHNTGLGVGSVRAILVLSNSAVYVGGAGGISRFDGSNWTVQATGLTSTDIRALARTANDEVYVAAYGSSTGGISHFDGSIWQPLPDLNSTRPNLYTALTVDASNKVWVGTESDGLIRWDGSNPQTFSVNNGLVSNAVSGLAAEAGAVWMSAPLNITAQGMFGGVGRYDLSTRQWQSYTQASGLTSIDVLSVFIDGLGRKWFGTRAGGLNGFDGDNWWAYDTVDGLSSNDIRVAVVGPTGLAYAGSASNIDQLQATPIGNPPVVSSIDATLVGLELQLQAAAADGDSSGLRITSYDWQSSLDGPLATEAGFAVRRSKLTPGLHTISVRALDDEGVWSAPMTKTVNVPPLMNVYLPNLLR